MMHPLPSIRRHVRFALLTLLSGLSLPLAAQEHDPARRLIEEVVAAVGGVERLHTLRDVEYEYVYRNVETGEADISLERYVFDGELSWARYTQRQTNWPPEARGELVQGYNGDSTWATLDGEPVTDPQLLRMSDFLRKTNYYWFTMMFKLLDPGLTYELMDPQVIDDGPPEAYHRVKIGFEDNVGDVQDTYVLYIHPRTRLVDQFLFTVLDFGRADPLLMKVEYEEIEGLKLPTERRYAPADWDGNILEEKWTEEISRNVRFENGFEREMFEAPE